jgi:hypothetical protein
MAQYSVYEADFVTQRGTKRYYIGCTQNVWKRESELQFGPRQPAWLQAGTGHFHFHVLKAGLPSRGAALATEALLTARRFKAAPYVTRGGPWLLPCLPSPDLRELEAVGLCIDIKGVFDVVDKFPDGSLHQHLKNLSFSQGAASTPTAASKRKLGQCAPAALASSLSKKGMTKVQYKRPSGRSRQSGRGPRKSGRKTAQLSGCQNRKKRTGLKKGTAAWEKAKWGKDPAGAKSDAWKRWKQNSA